MDPWSERVDVRGQPCGLNAEDFYICADCIPVVDPNSILDDTIYRSPGNIYPGRSSIGQNIRGWSRGLWVAYGFDYG
jgi:hypothetical protein